MRDLLLFIGLDSTRKGRCDRSVTGLTGLRTSKKIYRHTHMNTHTHIYRYRHRHM